MLGTTEDVNRANAQTAEEVFISWQTIPRLDRRKDTLNCKLLPLYGTTGAGVEFDYEDPSPDNREEDNGELTAKATAAATLVNAGFDPDDVLETVGLPSMDVVEKATQAPALPPGWVAGTPPGAPPAGTPNQDEDGPQARERIQISAKRDPAARVFEQLAADYPPEALGWVHHAGWAGPVKVPLDHVDPDMSALDKAVPEHVGDFVKQLQAGKKIKPVILVKTPEGGKLLLVDGHHRFLACKQENVPVRAFIATVDAGHGGWETMHTQQLHPTPPANRYRSVTGAAAMENWVAQETACDECKAKAAGSPYPAGSQEPPLHRNCECATEDVAAGADLANLLRRVLSDGYVPVEMGRRG